MRFKSSPESADERDPTICAILETVIAIVIIFGLSVYTNDYWPIMAVTVISPLMILSTPRSGVISFLFITYFSKILDNYLRNSEYNIPRVFLILSIPAYLPVIFYLCRLLSIIKEIINGKKIVSNFPYNWQRMVFCIDSFHYPEVFRGVENDQSLAHRYFRNRELIFDFEDFKIKALTGGIDTSNRGFMIFQIILTFGIILPAVILRISVKASAIVWLPLIWIASQARSIDRLSTRLLFIRESAIQFVMRFWSITVIVSFLTKLWIWYSWERISGWWLALWPNEPLWTLATQMVWPVGMPLWQILAFLNAVIAIGIWFWAQNLSIALKVEQEGGEKIQEKRIIRQMNYVNALRSAISLYVIICSLWILISTSLEIDLPTLDVLIAPWSERPEIRLFDG